MIQLSALLLVLSAQVSRCWSRTGAFTFDGDIRLYAVANRSVYVATDDRLYQLDRDLTLVHNVTLRGVLKGPSDPNDVQFNRVPEASWWNDTFRINVLLPFVEDGTLISCGFMDGGCGHCEVLMLGDITRLLYNESIPVGALTRNYTSVALLVKVAGNGGAKIDTFILTAIEQNKDETDKVGCVKDGMTVKLLDADRKHEGGIFSLVDETHSPSIQSKKDVDFVDGFQVGLIIYLLSNVRTDATGNTIRLLWLKGETTKHDTLKSLRGATLLSSDPTRAHRLVASSVVSGGQQQPVLLAAVLSVDRSSSDTVLMVFDISPDLSRKENTDPHFYFALETKDGEAKMLRPEAVIFKQSNITCVRALRHKTWLVFLIGTEDGQLIKLAVDKNYHASCPIVLYRADDDRPVFPRIHLDEVDEKHVFVPLRNQMERVPVSLCGTYTTVQECWSAQDPHCVWCGSKKRCTWEDDCADLDWLSIPEDYQEKMVSYRVTKEPTGQITLDVRAHLTASRAARSAFTCHLSASAIAPGGPCGPPAQFPQCTCNLTRGELPAKGHAVTVVIQLGSMQLREELTLTNCSDLKGPPTPVLCQQCIRAGCGWDTNKCSWANEGVANDSVCQLMWSGMNLSKPEISSISPSVVSFYGRNQVALSGQNLGDVVAVRMQGNTGCTPRDSPVWNNTGASLTFRIPSADKKGVVRVCALLPDGSCHGDVNITYQSSPSCSGVVPASTWASGKRKMTLLGSHLDFVEGVMHSRAPKEVQLPVNQSNQNLTYLTHAARNMPGTFDRTVSLLVANRTLPCDVAITYYPEPQFTSFKSIRVGELVRVTIQKKTDRLAMGPEELSVWGVQSGRHQPCVVTAKERHSETETFTCEIKDWGHAEIRQLMIQYGDETVVLDFKSSLMFMWALLVLLLIPFIIGMVVIIYRRKQKKLTAEMNRLMEDLELDIRNDIRQGFVELQTEKSDLLENVGAIPFLDYKHFASRIFFPENDSLMTLCIKDIGQDSVKVQLDECCQRLSGLLQDQLFLTSMVHALEEQKSFTIKDKCTVASLLTVALHSDLLYLTHVMQTLLKDLMQQSSSAQPKLLLRRTESVVEKLLTNWMSICLYGFLRESVGQHLFLMVSALTQQIKKGPVDCVTEKALYTLSEDWLLWQAQDFTSVKLKVLFAVGSDGEVSEPLEVDALSCDSVEQVKEKILSTFKAKFGFAYNHPIRDVRIELERHGSFVPLEEVDGSSQVIGEVTMLNTLKHYKVPDGASIKVLSKSTHPPLSPQGSVKDDENFCGKYFHLIDPEVDEDQRKDPERKKLKLKEVHLTKLLSTKVAVHSFVGKLFESIWGLTHGKAPHAIKYFFGFLDVQAESMKVADPDVLHIWKTNSLPLRFWINILKNPQFVFDMEKTPQLDGCLSVIAQAFMDSFSLSEAQLGKHTPTNKLLYAKDIPGYKQEVKAYYKLIRDQPSIPDSEFKSFLEAESKKHHNEFNESAALREIYKFVVKYFSEITEKLNENGAPAELMEKLHHVKSLFDGLKSCSWS